MKAKKLPAAVRTRRRLLVSDPMCVLRYGHNVAAMNYFRDLLSVRFDDIVCLGCKYLPAGADDAAHIARFYDYYYAEFVDLEHLEKLGSDWPTSVDPLVADPMETLAIADSKRALVEYQIGPNDAIFFPSVDFYGVLGMIDAVSEIEAAKRPTLYLRFIGVMENASKVYRQPLDELLRRIRGSVASGTRMQLSAETPSYADYLSSLLAQVVLVTPYPSTWEITPFPVAPPFVVAAIGTGRSDKGFFELVPIFSKLRLRDPDLQIWFTAQVLPDKDLQSQMAYASQLYAIPGLDLLPASMPSAALAETYRRASVILLPYDVEIYKYRGSAVLMEAASIGRPVLTYPGTGFAAQVSYYGLGRICENHDQYVDSVFEYLHLAPSSLATAVRQARARFFTDAMSAYRSWIL